MYSATHHIISFFSRQYALCAQAARLALAPVFLLFLFVLTAGMTDNSRVAAQMAPDISGSWRGTLVAGQFDPVEIIFHIQGGDGNYSATLDIPSQSRTGLPVDSVSVTGSTITIRMHALQAEFYASLVMEDDNSTVEALNGDWGQSGEHIPLRMHRDRL